jgi:murein DD-endopeptidase MepM/ murein hydrolase activator NlpD
MERDDQVITIHRVVALMVVGAVTAGCSVYQPLDRGSGVPWAMAPEATGQVTATAGAVGSSGDRYRVRPGDRLGTLAERFGVSVRDVATANGLEAPYVIYVGQELRIPAGGATVAGGDGYTVRPGDTLSGIARRLDLPMAQLATTNGMHQPYRVYAGQRLRIPHGGDASPNAVVAKPTAVAAAASPSAPVARKSITVAAVAAPASDAPAKLEPAMALVKGQGKPPPLSDEGFLWPVNGKVVGGFGPIDQWRRRDGIDIAARKGAPVLAAQDGVVAYAGDGIRGYGRMILLRHADGYITTYAYNSALLVEVGDVVERGQVIARVGDSGDATGSMLHFELRKGKEPIDPESRLVGGATAMASGG